MKGGSPLHDGPNTRTTLIKITRKKKKKRKHEEEVQGDYGLVQELVAWR